MSEQRNIIVVDYDPTWAKQYEIASKEVQDILKDELIEIYHIGSTSVPGLAAKPIIDMLVVVKDITTVDAYQAAFENIKYTAMGEYGIKNRRFFLRGPIHRTHHIHIFDIHNQEDIDRHLALPMYLQHHQEARDAYSAIKKEMAKKYPHDIDGYCDGKNAFVKELQLVALQWYKGNDMH